MSKGRSQFSRYLRRRTAFQGVFSAFKWLAENGSSIHRVEWLGEHPLLCAMSPRAAFLTFEILSHPQRKEEKETIAIGPAEYLALLNTNLLSGAPFRGGRYVAFTYLDAQPEPQINLGGSLSQQEEQVRELFKERYGSEDVLPVRCDSPSSNGNNSVSENVTNLISAEFFILNGYMVLTDCESGPDLIAFKTKLVDELRERRFIGSGASVSQLAAIRAFGRVTSNHLERGFNEEIIAIESESANPNRGIKQLTNGYQSQRFSYMGFFDKRVLAAPFFYQRKRELDVLTYDTNGISYWACSDPHPQSDFWRSKKSQFINEIQDVMKRMLLMNLTGSELLSMVSGKPLTQFAVSREAAKLGIDKVLDKIEANLLH